MYACTQVEERILCSSHGITEKAFARRNRYIVSTDFNLARHSSPSFGSQHLCSAYSQRCEVDWKSRECALRILPRADKLLFAFTTPLSLVNSMARIHVRLLGPCFKTGRMKSYDRQQPKLIVSKHPSDNQQQFRLTASSQP